MSVDSGMPGFNFIYEGSLEMLELGNARVRIHTADVEAYDRIMQKVEDGEIDRVTIRGIEYAKVRHGTWTIDNINEYDLSYGSTGYEPVYRCSSCGHVTESYLRLDRPIMPEDADFPDYCPNCGAKMDGEEQNDE